MTRPYRCKGTRRAGVLTCVLMGAIGLAGVVAGADRAWACDGVACVGDAIAQGAHGAGVAIERGARFTGYALERGAYGLGTAVQKGVDATGRAVGQVARDTGRVVTGQP